MKTCGNFQLIKSKPGLYNHPAQAVNYPMANTSSGNCEQHDSHSTPSIDPLMFRLRKNPVFDMSP